MGTFRRAGGTWRATRLEGAACRSPADRLRSPVKGAQNLKTRQHMVAIHLFKLEENYTSGRLCKKIATWLVETERRHTAEDVKDVWQMWTDRNG